MRNLYKHAAGWLGLMMITAAVGCFPIQTWRIPPSRTSQCLENDWGDVVDTIGHQSQIDKPCHDPCYEKRAVYRVFSRGQGPEVGDQGFRGYVEPSLPTVGDQKPDTYFVE